MKLNIHKLYKLAGIQETSQTLTDSITDTFKIIDTIHEADTTTAQPMHHPLDLFQTPRKDENTHTDQHTLYQQNAPQVQDGFYIVPKVIE